MVESQLMLGTQVLAAMPPQSTCSFLLELYLEKCWDNEICKKITIFCFESFWSTFEVVMEEPRCLDKIKRVSRVMCRNALLPFQEFEDWNIWLASFTGENMRWEAIGCVFAGLSSALLSLPERDGFFTTQTGARMDRNHFAVEMKDCLQACMSLSTYLDFLNILTVVITCRNMTLQTVVSGDTSKLKLIIKIVTADVWRSCVLETVRRSGERNNGVGLASSSLPTSNVPIRIEEILFWLCVWN